MLVGFMFSFGITSKSIPCNKNKNTESVYRFITDNDMKNIIKVISDQRQLLLSNFFTH